MKQLLIQTLETICPNHVYLHGTIAADVEYHESFITFWTDSTDDESFYDDDVHAVEWSFVVYYYSSDPANVGTVPAQIEAALKGAGFIPQGKGRDAPSDVATHTGWVQEFIYKEITDFMNPPIED